MGWHMKGHRVAWYDAPIERGLLWKHVDLSSTPRTYKKVRHNAACVAIPMLGRQKDRQIPGVY